MSVEPSSRLASLRQLLLRHRRPVAVLVYLGTAWISNVVAFLTRFDGQVPPRMWALQTEILPWLLAARSVGFLVFGRFQGLWRYPSLYDLRDIVLAVATSTIGFFVLVRWGFGMANYPRSIYVIDSLVLVALLSSLRLGRRMLDELRRQPGSKRVLVVGAGNAGEMIVRDMRHNRDYDLRPVGFIDDSPHRQGEHIQGVPVLGTRADIARIVAKTKPHEVLIAMPSAPPGVVRDLLQQLQPFRLPIRTLPSLREIVDGSLAVSQIRNLAIEDLLARPPVNLDPDPVRRLVAGKCVIVTGAGGSIGSELCRQIAPLEPVTLLLYERYENSLFAIANELRDRWPRLNIEPLVGDVGDSSRLNDVFSRHHPHVLFHAAAHKHVPLMEVSPSEAVKNNVFGTYCLADAAIQHGIERFILISTDKAVNPTSAMGVSKRVAEMIVQARSGEARTVFASVRFGNVLGSNGSVVPRFLDQIKAGGPVTVTHPEMRRYFMLIPEAVQLVMHAAAMARGGEVFVLDMGEQMRVVDMARTLIRLSGYVPEEDIDIRFTGLRPGEKLVEELVEADESLESSGTDKINRLRPRMTVSPAELDEELSHLRRCAADEDPQALRLALQRIVPSYVPEPEGPRKPMDEATAAGAGFADSTAASIDSKEESNPA